MTEGSFIFKEGNLVFGDGSLTVFSGPCVLEDMDMCLHVARTCRDMCAARGLGYVFKASFDKANRTSIYSYRGPGLDSGLDMLRTVQKEVGVPVITDIHTPEQAERVAEVAEFLQIPAFLCRQTDLVTAAAHTKRVVNIKKAQFMAPEDMAQVLHKCREAGNERVILCERGSVLGYRQLVVDFRGLVTMRGLGAPVMFDATHSVQSMGGSGTSSGGDRRYVLPLVRAAVAVGIDALFLETHPNPDAAKSDGPNMVPLDAMGGLLDEVCAYREAFAKTGFISVDRA